MLRMTGRQYALVCILIVLALVPTLALGAGLTGQIVPCDGVNCTVCNIADLAQNILNASIFIAVFLSAILFAYAGLKYVTSPVSSSQTGKAKDLFTNVLIGFIIILAAWLIINTIMSIMVDGTIVAPWNKIC